MGTIVITFHLGVIDLPYEDESTTTGDVAEYLEEEYQIMRTFFDRYGNDIADLMGRGLATNLENMLVSVPPLRGPLTESMLHVRDLFVALLDSEEISGMSDVPTRRALLGVSKRFKNRKGDPRASFTDTGNHQAVMHAWVSGVLNALPE